VVTEEPGGVDWRRTALKWALQALAMPAQVQLTLFDNYYEVALSWFDGAGGDPA